MPKNIFLQNFVPHSKYHERLDNATFNEQIDSMLPCVCSVIDHRWCQNVVKTMKWQWATGECVTDVTKATCTAGITV